jgi:DNA-binding MarR family transcriptional regulator
VKAAMPFDDALLTELVQTTRDVTSAFDRYVGLSPARVAILLELSRCGECSQADLQRRNKVHGASITRQVQAMEADGLLVRRPDPADNRFTLVMLTEAGHEAVAQLRAKRESFRAQLLAGVPEADREGTWRFLRYIQDRLPDA